MNDTLTTEDSSDDEYDPEAEDSDEEEEEEEEEEEKRENVSVDDGETQESKSKYWHMYGTELNNVVCAITCKCTLDYNHAGISSNDSHTNQMYLNACMCTKHSIIFVI